MKTFNLESVYNDKIFDIPDTEIQVIGQILGFKYSVRMDLTPPREPYHAVARTPEQQIDTALAMVKRSMMLRLKYPDLSEEEWIRKWILVIYEKI